jgi:hypothetical protein
VSASHWLKRSGFQARSEHLATEGPNGGLRYVDVWENEADCDRFVEERLHPVIAALLVDVFGDSPPPEPERHVLGVVHLWNP